MKLTFEQKLEIESNGRAALSYVQSTTDLVFEEFDNGNYRFNSNGIRYGSLLTAIREDGWVVITWVPEAAYDNYAKETRFKYDATDGVDDIIPFLSWLNGIKSSLGL